MCSDRCNAAALYPATRFRPPVPNRTGPLEALASRLANHAARGAVRVFLGAQRESPAIRSAFGATAIGGLFFGVAANGANAEMLCAGLSR